MKILVIDDSSVICDLVKFTLTMKNHEVITAKDGENGIKIAKKDQPDLILLDILMPKMNGYEACGILKKDKLTKNIPIFILSSKGQMDDIDQAFQYGADNYITKPFDPDKLNKIIFYKLSKINK
ncbi:MAG: response regulator [Candidatus Marinimicrobia bacterium]|nr:response regulator [Candidatus Neomarinimicrobiota bacterium]